jgi:hypothetical protein
MGRITLTVAKNVTREPETGGAMEKARWVALR